MAEKHLTSYWLFAVKPTFNAHKPLVNFNPEQHYPTGENDVWHDCFKCSGSYCVPDDGICVYCEWDHNEEA